MLAAGGHAGQATRALVLSFAATAAAGTKDPHGCCFSLVKDLTGNARKPDFGSR